MPLVDPVMMAHLPAICLAVVLSFFFVIRPPFSGGGFRNPGRRPQHLDVLDAVFVIRRRRGDETERDIEALEAGLRADADRLPRPERLRPAQRPPHQLASPSPAPPPPAPRQPPR